MVVGYPNGTRAFAPGEIIQSKTSVGFRIDRAGDNPAVLVLDGGEDTGRGMSGGGLFDSQGNLRGLYFGQDFEELSRHAIASQALMESLMQKGYTYRQATSQTIGSYVRELLFDFHSITGLLTKFSWLPVIASLLQICRAALAECQFACRHHTSLFHWPAAALPLCAVGCKRITTTCKDRTLSVGLLLLSCAIYYAHLLSKLDLFRYG